ncbi:MAG TPA: hypothetical protein VKH19_17985, partial [Gemmatimonadaceae bacterium]|nr:hypothetical protein [Gemmatimonadaceae bacterium]
MCSARLIVASAVLLLSGARVAMSQDVRAYQRRLDSLIGVWRQAHDASVAHALQQKAVYTQSDTVRAGPITVLASKDRVTLARHAADSVQASLAPSYGSALDLLRERAFLVRDVTPADADGVDSGYVVVLEITPTGDETYRQVLVD